MKLQFSGTTFWEPLLEVHLTQAILQDWARLEFVVRSIIQK